MPDNRVNLQVKQTEGDELFDGNGWPTPLTDPSSQLKMKVTNGGNGEQRNFDPVSTINQDQLSLAEGKPKVNTGDMQAQGGHWNKFQTSQQNEGDHSTPESERSQ